MSVAAFFDLDKTLIDVNSGMLWARYERRRGELSGWQMARAAVWGGLYHLALTDMESAFDEACRHYAGREEAELAARTREWFEEEVAHRFRPGAQAVLDEHRARGEPLVLLTSSSSYAATVASETWGFDHWLANVFPTDDEGRLVGTARRPLCYGPGKVVWAERWAEERGVDLDASWFYSDSYSDLPMLERVGNPRVIAPDPRLRRAARKRGWQVLDWSATPQAAEASE